jgi:plastocyanin
MDDSRSEDPMSRATASPEASGGRARRWAARIVLAGLALSLAAYSTITISGAVALAGAHDESGTIRGRVSLSGGVQFAGETPAPQPIDMAADEYCLSAHEGEAVLDSPVLTDENGFLRDVVVYVREGLAEGEHPAPEATELLDQEGCLYAPRALAVQAGQTLVIRNSDATLHNVNVTASENRGFNIGQPIKGIEAKRSFDAPEIGIEVACDIHGWMHANISVFDHPYFDVTRQDGGFTIEGLPPGDYVIEAWHPALGAVETPISMPATGSAEVELVFGP